MTKWFGWLTLPPVVMVVSAAGMWVSRWLSAGRWQEHHLILSAAGVLVVIAAGIMFSASRAFHHADTTLHPQKLHHVKTLIVGGVFRFSRNPIYLGQVILLAAWALVVGGWGAWLWWLLYFAYLDGVQIPREERFLGTRFGADYSEFCRRVRRWF